MLLIIISGDLGDSKLKVKIPNNDQKSPSISPNKETTCALKIQPVLIKNFENQMKQTDNSEIINKKRNETDATPEVSFVRKELKRLSDNAIATIPAKRITVSKNIFKTPPVNPAITPPAPVNEHIFLTDVNPKQEYESILPDDDMDESLLPIKKCETEMDEPKSLLLDHKALSNEICNELKVYIKYEMEKLKQELTASFKSFIDSRMRQGYTALIPRLDQRNVVHNIGNTTIKFGKRNETEKCIPPADMRNYSELVTFNKQLENSAVMKNVVCLFF